MDPASMPKTLGPALETAAQLAELQQVVDAALPTPHGDVEAALPTPMPMPDSTRSLPRPSDV